MKCPKCGSQRFNFRLVTGFERVMILLTGKHKYRCRECALAFRAPDRRRTPRVESADLQKDPRTAQTLR